MDPRLTLLFILAGAVAAFVRGRWRHDMVALGALLAAVLGGLVPAREAFAGFGHPAVITVAAVLVLSRALQGSGAIDALARRAIPDHPSPTLAIAALSGLAAALSAFMNNVGALALLMPIGVQVARKHGLPPGQVLMPVAFASILGGMTTLIGTPPNLIVSGFRGRTGAGTFGMFDFVPVGLPVAAAGVLLIALVGWRLVPRRERRDAEGFDTGAYLTEVRVVEQGKADGMTLGEVEAAVEAAEAQVIGLIRHDVRLPAPAASRRLRAGDILVIEADPEGLAATLASLGLRLAEDVPREGAGPAPAERPDEVTLMELAILPASTLVGRSASDIRLRTRLGINLLAVSRQGRRSITRLRTMRLYAGDVLLVQGPAEALAEFATESGCVPLAERPLRIPDTRQALTATAILAGAIGVAAFGLVPAAIAFAAGVLACMALGLVPPRKVYEAVDWPVIVLLGALIPVAGAMASTGAADLLAHLLLDHLAQGHPVVALAAVLIVTMTLSDFMNNAATAAVMCPIAVGAAERLGASADAFLMAVAIGASCAFLTPIGHQNNTLILGPGGFRFGDYWRLGLPLEILVVAVSVPALLLAWPL